MLVPPLPWDRPHRRDCGGERVVLLHGLWRGWRAMEPLARKLNAAGYSTLNLPYPSTRKPVQEILPLIRAEVARVAGDAPVHFVTHSLGGILVRALLREECPWHQGRLVMLAPPNNGCEIVDWAEDHPLMKFFLGPSGRCLGSTGLPSSLDALPAGLEAAVIMGKRCLIPFFRDLLEQDNDGIVSASRGRIEGIRGFSVIDADHTFIQLHPDAVRQTLAFLKSGRLPET